MAGSYGSGEELLGLLAAIPLFSEINAGELAQIAAATRDLRLRRGDIVCRPGENPLGFHYVVEGQIKLALLSADGSEKVIEVVRTGMSFGETLLFTDHPCSVYAQALEDTALLHIGRDAVLETLTRSSTLALQMLTGLSRRLHHIIADVEAYCFKPAAQRIVGYLVREAETAAHREAPITITLPVSKSIVASQLSVTPETLSRVLHCLMHEGLISVHGRTIRVYDVDRLKNSGPNTWARLRV